MSSIPSLGKESNYLWLLRLAKDKHDSLFYRNQSDEELNKAFYEIVNLVDEIRRVSVADGVVGEQRSAVDV